MYKYENTIWNCNLQLVEFKEGVEWNTQFQTTNFTVSNPNKPIDKMRYKKGKAIPVTGREAHRVVRRRGSHIFVDKRLTDGGEVISLTHRSPFTPRKISGTHFC
jgi:hypothetical protein